MNQDYFNNLNCILRKGLALFWSPEHRRTTRFLKMVEICIFKFGVAPHSYANVWIF